MSATATSSRAAQARINGSKSHGAVTPEGKEKASWTTLRHGFRSHRDVIDGESLETYQRFTAIYQNAIAPRNLIEAELLDSAVSARWRARRAQWMETCTYNLSAIFGEDHWRRFTAHVGALGPEYQQALAFHDALKGKDKPFDIMALHLVEERLTNRWRRNLTAIQKGRGKNYTFPAWEELLTAEAELPNNFGFHWEPLDGADPAMEADPLPEEIQNCTPLPDPPLPPDDPDPVPAAPAAPAAKQNWTPLPTTAAPSTWLWSDTNFINAPDNPNYAAGRGHYRSSSSISKDSGANTACFTPG